MSSAFMVLVVAALLLAAPGNVCAQVRTDTYWGVAKNEGGTVLYKEKHEVRYENGRVQNSLTTYLDPSGLEFAWLESDYRLSTMMPAYVFTDSRRGYKEGLRFEGGRYYIFYADSGKAEKTKVLDDRTNVYSCQGWHYYLVENLDRVEGGDALEVRLVFPNRLQPYTFKILSLGSEGNTIRVKVKIANWLLSLFVPHLEVVYDKEKGIVEYYGVSNILDAGGELQKVHIAYQY